MAPYEALYRCKYQTLIGWTELVEHRLLGLDLVYKAEQTVRMIWDRLKIAFDRQKIYVDLKCRDIKYDASDKVFLKVSPWRKSEEELVEILEGDEKVLRRKTVKMVKVLWRNQGYDESSWETEETVKVQYLHLFPPGKF
ncbi:uncharacterized protein LOC120204751 [Hibiscus syriacus]|uniref:uncharacterized protein LOC120204751 n=1 Tax=Hibiscus syriacus TaxID=106335 RepID=UPI0019208AB8|nr:uncharacterized protein LOC120204751 [Hibiscus syriacus]